MGIGNRPEFILLILLLTSCVSSHHVPMGQEKRREVFDIYSTHPDIFYAEYSSGDLVYSGLNNESVESAFFDEDRYFDSLLKDMGFCVDDAVVTLRFIELPDQYTSLFYLEPAGIPLSGTVFFFHGYFDYSAKFCEFFSALLDAGYCVVAPELPGHGLSTGPRGEVRSFTDYRILVERTLDWSHTTALPHPFFGAGHSTGSASLAMYALGTEDPEFNAVFLGSPLGRTKAYYPSVIGTVLLRPFMYGVKAEWRGDYSLNYVPLSWSTAQRDWVKTHESLEESALPVFLAWGENDDTLDLDYSKNLYNRVFTNHEYVVFPDAGHNLYIDSEQKDNVFSAAIEFFSLHTDH